MAFTVDGFNIGQDCSLTFKSTTGESFNADQLGHLVHFEIDQDDKEISVHPISRGGKPIFDRTPHGWTGKLGWARCGGQLDDLLIQIDENFFDSGTRTKFTMTQMVQNRDGSIDTYLMEGVVFSKGKAGDFKADKEVEQGVTFRCATRRKTGGGAGLLASTKQ